MKIHGNFERSAHIFLPEDAAPTAAGGAGPGNEVELPLGAGVGGGHGVDADAPAGDGPDLPDLVDLLPGAVPEHERAEHPDAAVGAGLGGQARGLVRDGPGGAERVSGDVVGLDAVRAAGGGRGRGDERLRAAHALAGRVEAPGDPAAGGGRGREEGDGEGRGRGVVGPVHGRAQGR